MDEVVFYVFILALMLIFVAYFAGFATDVQAVQGAGVNLLNAATGRNSSGQFAAYPTGAPTAGATTTTL
jgi:hypothetical protein